MLFYRMSLLALPLMLSACATIVEGTDQTVSIITYPPEASCKLLRGGEVLAFVNPTPGTVSLEKSADDITVHCAKDDHFDSVETLTSSLQGMTFGNIIFGGIVGVAVDASSGAMHEYDKSISVILIPKRFASSEARDEFFDQQARRIEAEAAAAIAEVEEACQPDKQNCDALMKEIEAERDARLSELTIQKDTAIIE